MVKGGADILLQVVSVPLLLCRGGRFLRILFPTTGVCSVIVHRGCYVAGITEGL